MAIATSKVPEPLGYPEAIQAVGGVAAPLLAGFSLSAITLLIGTQPGVRWPGLSLFLFAFATVAFVTAVQTAFHARMHAASPAQMLEWWPRADAERIAALRIEQALDSRRHAWWAGLCRYTYNAWIVSVLLALATVVVPPGDVACVRLRLRHTFHAGDVGGPPLPVIDAESDDRPGGHTRSRRE